VRSEAICSIDQPDRSVRPWGERTDRPQGEM
jgi:hypothetical protein